MSHSQRLIALAAGAALLAPPAFAQAPAPKPKAPQEAPAVKRKSAASAASDLALEARREQARSLLFTLSGEARGFRNQTLRARSLSRIADALWGVTPEQGRVLFREAWEAAGKADHENEGRPNLRRGVLTLAARRDPQLAEELLQQLRAEQEDVKAAAARNAPPAGEDLWKLPMAAEKRLELAVNLLNAGDVKGALQFADPVLGSVTISTLDFLSSLREKDAAAADRRYAVILERTAGDSRADANTVSLLSSYIFTPRTYVVFNRSGGADASFRRISYPRAQVAPQLQLAFFQTARAILLRPQAQLEQEQSTAGVAGKYMVLKRLLPLFEQNAPQEIAAAVRGHFEALSVGVDDGVRQGEDEWVRKGISPESLPAEQERPLLDAVERAGNSDERDQLYIRLALLALGRDDAAALDYVGKIANTLLRQRVRAWVDWSLVVGAVEAKRVDAALELARVGELTPIQRVWVWTRAARLLPEADRDKALALLDDAASEVRRIDRTDAHRAGGHLAVANALRLVDPARAWDALADAIEAANAVEGFTGEGGELSLSLNSKGEILVKAEVVPEFNIEGAFGEAAKADFDRAAHAARSFKGEAARVNAIIAVSRAVINEPIPAALPAGRR
ncbi:MAG TPA: hypothetical protein VK422_07375 [Pyrinomonadaceae bacterium]|nr:hypothetical protein [Pyrinomonadaceae bacterium]